ncbi:MAG: phosphohydrolase [Treponema sp.]|nr:phosphohydrolase [Treponema sp.]
MKSAKELSVDGKINEILESLCNNGSAVLAVAKILLDDEEIQAVQEYANTVSIIRFGYNDHGPVHMRTVMLNAVIMMGLLKKAGIKTSLETEGCGSFEDSLAAVILGAMLHDLGMSIGRQDHELHSVYLAAPIMDRLLTQIFAKDIRRRVLVRSLALEGIIGHMGNRSVHSLEAGVIQVADGCDMKKGRARIPIALHHNPRAGNIHQHSADSIEDVKIGPGKEKPIRIDIFMSGKVGLFQVEEVLLGKISSSTAKPHIELYAKVLEEAPLRYL